MIDTTRRHLHHYQTTGEESAFQKVVEENDSKLRSYVVQTIGLVDEDIMQEVWTRVYEKIQSYDQTLGGYSWLSKIARDFAVDYLRKKDAIKRGGDSVIKSLALTASRFLGGRVGEGYRRLRESEPDLLLTEERLEHLQTAFVELPHRDQQLLRCIFHEGLPYREVAARCGLKVTGVGAERRRVLTRLKTMMKRQGVPC